MSELEEEIRRALFGVSRGVTSSPTQSVNPHGKAPKRHRSSAMIKVTLKVSKVFEGDTELFVNESSTLSTISAEIDARNAAKKKRFKYIDLVCVERID